MPIRMAQLRIARNALPWNTTRSGRADVAIAPLRPHEGVPEVPNRTDLMARRRQSVEQFFKCNSRFPPTNGG